MITLRAKLVLLSMVARSPLGAGSVDCFGTVAATDQNLRPKGAHLTLRSVLQLAQREASIHGISAAAFEATQYSFSCQNDRSCEWTIVYVGKAFTWHGQPA